MSRNAQKGNSSFKVLNYKKDFVLRFRESVGINILQQNLEMFNIKLNDVLE